MPRALRELVKELREPVAHGYVSNGTIEMSLCADKLEQALDAWDEGLKQDSVITPRWVREQLIGKKG